MEMCWLLTESCYMLLQGLQHWMGAAGGIANPVVAYFPSLPQEWTNFEARFHVKTKGVFNFTSDIQFFWEIQKKFYIRTAIKSPISFELSALNRRCSQT